MLFGPFEFEEKHIPKYLAYAIQSYGEHQTLTRPNQGLK